VEPIITLFPQQNRRSREQPNTTISRKVLHIHSSRGFLAMSLFEYKRGTLCKVGKDTALKTHSTG
jgi:hypothetical protein